MLALALKRAPSMKLVHVVGNVRWRLLSLMRSTILAALPNASALPRDGESRDVE